LSIKFSGKEKGQQNFLHFLVLFTVVNVKIQQNSQVSA